MVTIFIFNINFVIRFYRATQLCKRRLGSRNSVRLPHACFVTNPKHIDERNVPPKIKNVKKRKNVTKIKKTFTNVE